MLHFYCLLYILQFEPVSILSDIYFTFEWSYNNYTLCDINWVYATVVSDKQISSVFTLSMNIHYLIKHYIWNRSLIWIWDCWSVFHIFICFYYVLYLGSPVLIYVLGFLITQNKFWLYKDVCNQLHIGRQEYHVLFRMAKTL